MSERSKAGGRCPRCDTSGQWAAGDGLCPGCLLELALEVEPAEEDEGFSGETCGIYQLDGVLGRGGNGIVFLARRPGSAMTYALKMLASARLAGPDELRRFNLEAESAMALEHPNIVRVVDLGEEDGVPFFVMELAAGGSLADLLAGAEDAASLKSSLRERVGLLILVARAVQFAHERGVLHRDLKPANILIAGDGRPLVGDFGLARLIHAPSGVTMTGAALGTPAYMAPEQAAGAAVTIAADVYGLGAVLFHLLAGQPPFEGRTPLETLRLVTSVDAPDPRSLAPWIDRDLAMICLTALRREIPRRYASAGLLADDLQRWSEGEAVMARPLSWPEKLVKSCRRHPIAATLALSTAVAAAVLATVFVTGSMMLREERNRALRQEAIARVNAASATLARDQFRLNSYAADLYLAFRALDDGHLGQARRMLARHEPTPGLPDLRGFEWHALSRRCRGDDAKSWTDHDGAVSAAAFSPDGKWLATGGRDGRVWVRSIPDGGVALALPRPDVPRGAAEIPLMTAVTARSAELKRQLLEIPLNPDEIRMRGRPSRLGEVEALAWAPDGRRIATGGLGSYVRIWSFPEGDLLGIVPVITARAIAFGPDGSTLAVFLGCTSEAAGHELRIYQNDLSCAASIGGLAEAFAFSNEGGSVATLDSGGTRLTLRDAATGSERRSFAPAVPLKRLAFSRDGSLLWGVETGGAFVAAWRVSDGLRTATAFPVAGRFDRLETLPGGNRLVSTGAGQSLIVQHAAGAEPAAMMGGHEDAIRSLTVSPDGRWIATGGNDHTTRLWRATPEPPAKVDGGGAGAAEPLPAALRALVKPSSLTARTRHGLWIGGPEAGHDVEFFDDDGVRRRAVKGPGGPIARLVSPADGSRLAAFSWPRGLRLLEADGSSWSGSWKLSPGTVGPIVFSPDGGWIASGGDDNMITVRRVPDGAVLAQLKGHQGAIVEIAFTPDGRTLVSSSTDRTLRLWHTATWRDLGTLHRGELLGGLSFSADGLKLTAMAADGALREFGRAGD